MAYSTGAMPGPFLLHLIAAIGWLIVAVFAYAFITLFGFFGVGFYGLLILFMCVQIEIEPDPHSHTHRWLNTRIFKLLGFGLTVIGFGGFVYFQLNG